MVRFDGFLLHTQDLAIVKKNIVISLSEHLLSLLQVALETLLSWEPAAGDNPRLVWIHQ